MAIYSDFHKHAFGLFTRVFGLVDRVIVSPETRSQFYSNVSVFANEQPLLFTFLLIQLLLSFTPIALFASFVLGTLLLSFLSAALFSLFWIGISLLILIPTLFITVSLGILIWIWAISSFMVAKWVYRIVPVNVRGGMQVEMPNEKEMTAKKTGEGYGDVET
jgi:hypothetical protein